MAGVRLPALLAGHHMAHPAGLAEPTPYNILVRLFGLQSHRQPGRTAPDLRIETVHDDRSLTVPWGAKLDP